MEPLEQRVAELERKLAEYEKYVVIDQNYVRIKKAFLAEQTTILNNVPFYQGKGAPGFTAPKGSLYVNRSGGVGGILYTNYGGSNWDALN